MHLSHAALFLENGQVFNGNFIGNEGIAFGEVIFNTAMTGYQEILTDPSYHGQILTFTSAHIGNTGINFSDNESDSIQVAAMIARDVPDEFCNWRGKYSLRKFLDDQKVIGIKNVDTRRLVRVLREKGTIHACIASNDISSEEAVKLIQKHKIINLIKINNKKIILQEDAHPVYTLVVFDFGVKKSILTSLLNRKCKLIIVPGNTTAQEIIDLSPDGIVLSNGPGDPADYKEAIQEIKKLYKTNIPILGICLGHQLLALATGAKIIKMQYGHHGANHPVLHLMTDKIYITSQNHNYVIVDESTTNKMLVTHRSVFDNTIQGISYQDKPILSFQGHSEGGPGPIDINNQILDEYLNLIITSRNSVCANA